MEFLKFKKFSRKGDLFYSAIFKSFKKMYSLYLLSLENISNGSESFNILFLYIDLF